MPVSHLKGVGPQLSEKLKKLDILTLQDLLFHLPFRYEDRTRITQVAHAEPGESVVLEGDLLSCEIAFGRRRSLVCKLSDPSGMFCMRFYYFSRKQQEILARAKRVRCFGEVRRGALGWEVYHPEYTLLRGDEALEQTLTPIYSITEGITQARIRQLVTQTLELIGKDGSFEDLLKDDYPLGEVDVISALFTMHKPSSNDNPEALLEGTHPTQKRFAFEELLAHHAGQLKVREKIKKNKSFNLQDKSEFFKYFLSSLEFKLTNAQSRVVREIESDMKNTYPMQRLLQGDVGSGKTVVAALAAVHAMENGIQTAIMAPTEILAEQHLLNFSKWLGAIDAPLGWLSGKIKGKKRNEQLALIASGTAKIVIGTHALLQPDVDFHRLGLIIIDEQHRFGVSQRLTLLEKGKAVDGFPHQLFMTATPIPRTLTMSLYADMDTSVIDELPPGRKEISTRVLPDSRRQDIIDRIHGACKKGAQAYWVCTLIDESDSLEYKAAEETADRLRKDLSDLSIELIHGRMTPREKTAIMASFKAGEIDLLVSTTVIEVGVDVPNASLMVIENAERLGLAQLHQLRGRIGRGSAESFCLLMYHAPVSKRVKDRLNVIRNSTDGFFIAEQDLRMRGPGELLGRRQSGDLEFRIADLARDSDMLQEVSRVSRHLLKTDEGRVQKILDRWLSNKEGTSQV